MKTAPSYFEHYGRSIDLDTVEIPAVLVTEAEIDDVSAARFRRVIAGTGTESEQREAAALVRFLRAPPR